VRSSRVVVTAHVAVWGSPTFEIEIAAPDPVASVAQRQGPAYADFKRSSLE
jgi:hypothetical protein